MKLENKIIELADLILTLADTEMPSKVKANRINLAIKDGLISNDDGLELVIHFTTYPYRAVANPTDDG